MKILCITIYQDDINRTFFIERPDSYFSDPRQRVLYNSGNLSDGMLILRISKLL